MGRFTPPPDCLAIEEEMRAEGAAALRRLGERLDELLAALRALRAEVAGLADSEKRRRVIGQYEQLRRQAEYDRWCLVVQREAMGFRISQRDVDDAYPIPPRMAGG